MPRFEKIKIGIAIFWIVVVLAAYGKYFILAKWISLGASAP